MVWVHERVEVHKTEVRQVLRYYLPYNDEYRKLPNAQKACGLCRKSFKDGEYVNLALTDKRNKLICQTCADTAVGSGVKVHDRPKATDPTESPSEAVAG